MSYDVLPNFMLLFVLVNLTWKSGTAGLPRTTEVPTHTTNTVDSRSTTEASSAFSSFDNEKMPAAKSEVEQAKIDYAHSFITAFLSGTAESLLKDSTDFSDETKPLIMEDAKQVPNDIKFEDMIRNLKNNHINATEQKFQEHKGSKVSSKSLQNSQYYHHVTSDQTESGSSTFKSFDKNYPIDRSMVDITPDDSFEGFQNSPYPPPPPLRDIEYFDSKVEVSPSYDLKSAYFLRTPSGAGFGTPIYTRLQYSENRPEREKYWSWVKGIIAGLSGAFGFILGKKIIIILVGLALLLSMGLTGLTPAEAFNNFLINTGQSSSLNVTTIGPGGAQTYFKRVAYIADGLKDVAASTYSELSGFTDASDHLYNSFLIVKGELMKAWVLFQLNVVVPLVEFLQEKLDQLDSYKDSVVWPSDIVGDREYRAAAATQVYSLVTESLLGNISYVSPLFQLIRETLGGTNSSANLSTDFPEDKVKFNVHNQDSPNDIPEAASQRQVRERIDVIAGIETDVKDSQVELYDNNVQNELNDVKTDHGAENKQNEFFIPLHHHVETADDKDQSYVKHAEEYGSRYHVQPVIDGLFNQGNQQGASSYQETDDEAYSILVSNAETQDQAREHIHSSNHLNEKDHQNEPNSHKADGDTLNEFEPNAETPHQTGYHVHSSNHPYEKDHQHEPKSHQAEHQEAIDHIDDDETNKELATKSETHKQAPSSVYEMTAVSSGYEDNHHRLVNSAEHFNENHLNEETIEIGNRNMDAMEDEPYNSDITNQKNAAELIHPVLKTVIRHNSLQPSSGEAMNSPFSEGQDYVKDILDLRDRTEEPMEGRNKVDEYSKLEQNNYEETSLYGAELTADDVHYSILDALDIYDSHVGDLNDEHLGGEDETDRELDFGMISRNEPDRIDQGYGIVQSDYIHPEIRTW